MQSNLSKKIQKYIKEHLHEKHWKQAVAVLSCMVVCGTAYTLILPARAMTGATYCGLEEHQHTDECYEKVLTCGLKEGETEVITPAHTHTDACYKTESVLTCGQKEFAGHTHDDSCYDAEGNLTCKKEESEGHTHTEDCYETKSVLICGKEEVDEPETTEGHVHTEDCYEEKLICGKEEHEHSEECYSKPDADEESTSAAAETTGEESPADDSGAADDTAPEESSIDDTQPDESSVDDAQPTESVVDDTQPTESTADELKPAEQSGSEESIELGETKVVAVQAGEIVKLEFIPEYTHEYVFYSSTNGDTYGYLYDADGKELTCNDDGGSNRNFKITYTLTGGETYYWGAKWYSTTVTGDIPVQLELGTTHNYEADEDGKLVCTCGQEAPLSGTCGTDLSWAFDTETGTLSITGDGKMTNYSGFTAAPWQMFSEKIKKVEIAEGATSIGDYAFYKCADLEAVSFPGTLTSLGSVAFYECSALSEIDLSQTEITTIRLSAFSGCAELGKVSVPSTLTEINSAAFYKCSALTEIDLSGTKVTSIANNAFRYCYSLKTASFPDTLTEIQDYAFENCEALTEIDLSKTGVTSIGSNVFQNDTGLQTVKLPETLTSIGGYAFSSCRRLTEITIPEKVTTMGKDVFLDCDNLSELRLEAADVTFNSSQTVIKNGFHVTVTGTVDNLTADTITALDSMGCREMTFTGPGYLKAGDWQADFLPDRLNGLSNGEYFFDAQGVFYRIDSKTNTASVFYCPAGITSYGIPKELPAVDGKTTPVPVTGVDSFAFSEAADLTELTFDSPETITTLADMAFYRAEKLKMINDRSTAADILSIFTSKKLKTGTMLFWQTKIEDGDQQPSEGELVINKDNITLTVSTDKGQLGTEADGTYCYYTGEIARTTITISNADSSQYEDGTVVRVYFQFDEKKGNINYSPGEHLVSTANGNKYEMRVVKTDVDGCYYIELDRPVQGDTISIDVNSIYPSPNSGGGNAVLWCGILNKTEKENVGNGLIPVDEHQVMNWSTVADIFPIKKTETSTGSSQLAGDGSGGAYISGLSYTIRMSRYGDTLEGVGKDHMSSVEYDDVLTLPDGVTLADDVVESIQTGDVKVVNDSGYSGGYHFKTADGREFLTVEPSNPATNYQYLRDGTVALDENGRMVIHWRFLNADLKTEMSDISFTYKVSDNTLIVKDPKADTIYTVDNSVTASQHFMYSDDQVQKDECSATVKTASSGLKVEKTAVKNLRVYGEQNPYIITANNPGALPYEELAYLTDDLPTQLYMRPADIAAMFTEDEEERQLTITIVNATLCEAKGGENISGIDGTAGVTNQQNSGSKTEYSGTSIIDPDAQADKNATVRISWGTDDKLQIEVQDGKTLICAVEEDAIKNVLQTLGFVVTSRTQYCLKWNHCDENGNALPLRGGELITKNVFSTVKDTFMLLDNDTLNEHPSRRITVRNTAYGKDSNNRNLASRGVGVDIYREFYLNKNWSMNDQPIDEKTEIRQGNILDYTLSVKHSNGNYAPGGEYDALPLVDHMSGAQALLVPVEKNKDANWTEGLNTVKDKTNGVEYYILDRAGTYSKVWTSDDQLSDTIEVTKSETGLNTLIKWYFVNYSGRREDTITYRSYVCPDDLTPNALAYSLGNESWLNDHQSHRLYASLTGWKGTAFDFDKVIVDKVGDMGEGYRHSPVKEGETVTYRLMLSSLVDENGNYKPMTLTGSEMYDELPLSIENYRWSKNNIDIFYQEESDSYHVLNGNSWSVDEPVDGDQQYIRWADDFSITFTGTAFIYVQLKFPSDIPWQEYANAYGTSTLVNSFHVLSAQRSVTHEVAIAAKVRLQKGVYDIGYYYLPDATRQYKADIGTLDGRLYYQNDDAKIRAVKYYVTLYNAGVTNLYLTDMQDVLPRGFTYAGSRSFYTTIGSSYSSSNNCIWDTTNKLVVRKSALIYPSTTMDEEGREHITFHFVQDTRDPISYDADREMCYLKPGESIDFEYICQTNKAADTDDAAKNIVTMPYYDFNGAGVKVDDTYKIVSANSNIYTPNDGGCDVLNNGQIESLGFTGETADTQWLTSDVTLIRGDIKPGITKELTSKTDTSGMVEQHPVSAAPTDILNWTIKTENDGRNSISDYVLTDRMQVPYMFTGKVSYLVYTDPEITDQNLVAKPDQDYLFTIENGESDDTLKITTNLGEISTLTVGGQPISVSCKWNYSKNPEQNNDLYYKDAEIQISIKKDENGNAVLSMRFLDETMAIPENGSSLLKLSTRNAGNTAENKQFVNTCFITPLVQDTWDKTTNKGNVVSLDTPFSDEELPTVRNSSQVVTAFGYVTSSTKRVTEVEDPYNTAACTDDPNYIVLANKNRKFRYTITVNNSTPQAMTKLILIDGLPEVDDHTAFLADDPRFSEFKVSLDENPDFVVTVASNNDETPKRLDLSQYTIEYSTKTEFTSDDWDGTGTSEWYSSNTAGVRSIRLCIFDTELIPAGSIVSLEFTCKIDDPDVQPGQIAWNSFGYHYRLNGAQVDQEAAPLKVGVKIPSVPEVRKQIVDHSGQPRMAEKDETFYFLVYQGEALNDEYTTKNDLTAALDADGKLYDEFSVTVTKGESLSESVRLKADKWEWTNGEKYTVVELPNDESFSFKRFLNSAANSYTLTYNRAQTQIVTCENINQRWRIDLTKENTSKEPLRGAVFALYSPDEADKISSVPEGYTDFDIDLTTQYNNKTWYLVSVGTTDEKGKQSWSNLLREEYYLLEVKAPDGYNLNTPAGQILKQENETQGVYSVTVINRAGYTLPKTGGIGTHLYRLGGLLLLLSAGMLFLYQRTRRRKEGRNI